MLMETVAVLGRQFGKPLLGTVELMQAAILLAATSAMLCATISDAHARVTLLTERASPRWRCLLDAFSLALSVTFFVALAAGALWLAIDFWNAHEESELLHIPYKPLRVLSVIAALAIAIVLVWNFIRRRKAVR
jgi:TRAP-type C4-dicarboxylate transport system permease small subunit